MKKSLVVEIAEDIIRRLRYIADTDDARFGDISSTLTEAANCIEQLRKDMESTAGKALAAVALRDAEIARLRGLLRERCLAN